MRKEGVETWQLTGMVEGKDLKENSLIHKQTKQRNVSIQQHQASEDHQRLSKEEVHG